MMPEYHSVLQPDEPDGTEIKRAAAATVLLVALIALFAFAKPQDPTKVVSGVPCSVLSEQEISTVLGTTMRLMPTNGTVCQYVATGAGRSRALFVIARRNTTAPASIAHEGTIVRYSSRSYTFDVVPRSPVDASADAKELRLAKMMHPQVIAQNR